jgi:hypothetical protein
MAAARDIKPESEALPVGAVRPSGLDARADERMSELAIALTQTTKLASVLSGIPRLDSGMAAVSASLTEALGISSVFEGFSSGLGTGLAASMTSFTESLKVSSLLGETVDGFGASGMAAVSASLTGLIDSAASSSMKTKTFSLIGDLDFPVQDWMSDSRAIQPSEDRVIPASREVSNYEEVSSLLRAQNEILELMAERLSVAELRKSPSGWVIALNVAAIVGVAFAVGSFVLEWLTYAR